MSVLIHVFPELAHSRNTYLRILEPARLFGKLFEVHCSRVGGSEIFDEEAEGGVVARVVKRE